MAGTNAERYTVEYVYGDTDSVFFTFNFENPETGEFVFRVKPGGYELQSSPTHQELARQELPSLEKHAIDTRSK